MTDYVELEFHIENATPDTIPAKDLLKIAAAWVKELGENEYVHLKGVREGSVRLVVDIEKNAFPKAKKRISQKPAQDKLNKVLADHDKYGFIRAVNDNQGFEKINLEGIKLYEGRENTIIYDESQIKGRIVEIRGRDKTVNIDIVGSSGELYKCVIDSSEAQKMSWGDYIQADVSGDWILLENGKWDMPPRQKLKIERYKSIEMLSDKDVLSNMAGIISVQTFEKIQENIVLDMQGV